MFVRQKTDSKELQYQGMNESENEGGGLCRSVANSFRFRDYKATQAFISLIVG